MNQDYSDEIDLRQVARSVRDFIRSHARILLISILAGGALGLTAYFLIPPQYESELILQSDILKDHFSDRLSSNLNRLIDEKNYEVLGERLSLSSDEAQTLRAIEIEAVLQQPESGQGAVAKMTITARVTSLDVLPKLQNGLLHYLRNVDFVKVRVRQREQMYKVLIGQIEHEIHSLDSLKFNLLGRKNSVTNGAGLVLVDPTNIYGQLVELKRRQLEYKNALELFESIQVMEGFTPFHDPVYPKLYIMILMGLALGALTGLVLSIGQVWFYSSAS
jgi:hypothetical protein